MPSGRTASRYEVAGIGGSWFRYAGNFQWSWQRDWFDFGNAASLFMEMMTDGALSEGMTERMQRSSKPLPGHYRLGDAPVGLWEVVMGIGALDVLLIDGKLVPASDGSTFETVNPATEEVLGAAADGTVADMDAAIDAARRAFDEGDVGGPTRRSGHDVSASSVMRCSAMVTSCGR